MIDMGMYARAHVVYGVDLGDRDSEAFLEGPDEYMEEGVTEALDRLIDEYRGWDTSAEPDYVSEREDPEGHAKWSGYLDRRHEFLKGRPTPISYQSYGYEYGGTALISASAGSAEYSAEPLKLGETHHDELERFLQFLESKGFKFTNPEKRKPGWLVLASYG